MEKFTRWELMEVRAGLGVALLMAKEIERNSIRSANLRDLIVKISNIIDDMEA